METLRKLIFYFKNKFTSSNRTTPFVVEFSDFFICDKVFEHFGYSYFKANDKKWKKINFIAVQGFVMMLIVLAAVNILLFYDSLSYVVLIEDLAIVFVLGTIFFKWFPIIFLQRTKILNILRKLQKFFPKHFSARCNSNMRRKLLTLKRFFILNSCFCIMITTSYIFGPIVEQIYLTLSKQSEKQFLPLLSIYLPFYHQNNLYASMTYIIGIWCLYFASVTIIAVDNLFASISQLISIGIKDLAILLAENDMKNEKEAIELMKHVIKIHNEYLEIIKEVEEIFSFSLFVNMFGAIGSICMTAFLAIVIY